MRGDVYHEILLRMKGENDELISPDSFLPVEHEFGLSSSIDMWVIEHTLQFMAENRAKDVYKRQAEGRRNGDYW